MSTDKRSDLMDEDHFTSFSDMVAVNTLSNEHMPSVRDDIQQVEDTVATSPFGPDLWGDPGGLDAQQCSTGSELQEGSSSFVDHADVPFSRADVNKALFEARLHCLDDTGVKYPWETGVMAEIFMDTDDVVGAPSLPVEYLGLAEQHGASVDSSTAASASQKTLGRDLELPFYSFAVRVKPDRDLFAVQEVLWQRALDKWLQIFEVLGFPGQLGDAVDYELHFADPDQRGTVLRDAMGVKSPRTALKRAQTMLQYFGWLQNQPCEWSPWNRSNCLSYLNSSAEHTPAATLGMSFLEALRFCRHVLQINIPDLLLQDPQLKGRAQRLLLTKVDYHPARPLKAQEVARLERMMVSPMNLLDKYMLGAVLFAIFSRSRWSDLQFINKFWVDRNEFDGQFFGFIETETAFHKTATSLKKKMRFMPIVCPIQGITETDWTAAWLETFYELQVDADAIPFGPICRAPGTDGALCRRSCTSDEISLFINRVLDVADDNKLSSHGFKHTTLSWASSYGIDETARTLLGHHELQGSKSMSVYSRDMLTRPLQLFCSMLTNIRGDHFRPDESRTSRMLDLMKIKETGALSGPIGSNPGGAPAPVGPEVPVDDDAVPTTPLDDTTSVGKGDQKPQRVETDSDSSSLASTSSSSSDGENEDLPEPTPKTGEDFIAGPVLRNRRSHVVHKCADAEGKTLCNRMASEETFELLNDGCSTLNARCSRCFRGQVLTSSSAMAEALDQARAKRLKKD